jgi:hypothetical protein
MVNGLATWPPGKHKRNRKIPRQPPIRRKKSNVFSTGTPESFFDSSGASLPRHPARPCGGFRCCAYSYPALTKENRCHSARLGAVPLRWLYSCRLEKRSQALQACNLTRNIQADGAPMVHLAPGGKLQGPFFSPSDTRVMPWKTHRHSSARRLLSRRFSLSFGAVAFSSSAGDLRRPATYWGLSEEVHED